MGSDGKSLNDMFDIHKDLMHAQCEVMSLHRLYTPLTIIPVNFTGYYIFHTNIIALVSICFYQKVIALFIL